MMSVDWCRERAKKNQPSNEIVKQEHLKRIIIPMNVWQSGDCSSSDGDALSLFLWNGSEFVLDFCFILTSLFYR